MKLLITVLGVCLLTLLCSCLPVEDDRKNILAAVDADIKGDVNVGHVRTPRSFGGFGGLYRYGGFGANSGLGGYGGYGAYPGLYPGGYGHYGSYGGYGGYGSYGGYPGGHGFYPGVHGSYFGGVASASTSASAAFFGGGFRK